MRKAFDSVHPIPMLKRKELIYIPTEKSVVCFNISTNTKLTEINIDDQTLNIHGLNNGNIVIVGKSSKKIFIFDSQGTHLKE
jgi:hypothetical protein